MGFIHKQEYADRVGSFFGEYVTSYQTDGGEVSAELFRQKGALMAYLSYGAGRGPADVTVPYLDDLRRKALELGLTLELSLTGR